MKPCYDNAVIKPLRFLSEEDPMDAVAALWRQLRHAEYNLDKASGSEVIKPEARQRLRALADSVRGVLDEANLGGMGL